MDYQLEGKTAFVSAGAHGIGRATADLLTEEGACVIVAGIDEAARLDKYIYPADQPRVISVIQEAIRTKGTFQLEHRVRRADGSLAWTFSQAIPLLDENGEIVEWFGTASDVTARKMTEEKFRGTQANLELRVKERTEELEKVQIDLRDLSCLSPTL